MSIVIQWKTQDMKINMYNIHAHIERAKKKKNIRTEKDTNIGELISYTIDNTYKHLTTPIMFD